MTEASSTTTERAAPAGTDERACEAGDSDRREAAIGNLLQTASHRHTELPMAAGTACQAFRIGAQIGRLSAQHFDLDSAGRRPDSEQEGIRERAMRRATAESDLLQDAMTYVRATSTAGALAELVTGAQFVLRGIESSHDDDDREPLLRAALRCLYAIVPVLEEASGISARCFGSDYLMPEHLDAMARAQEPARVGLRNPGPKPTVDDERAGDLHTVEHQLLEMNRSAEVWWSIYQDSAGKEDEADEADPPDRAKKAMAEQAATHAIRIARERLIRAMSLPASTPRELGLQARLVALELREWWDDNKQQDGEIACRALLDRLMACAGVAPIRDSREVTPAEARDWLANPDRHYARYNPTPSGKGARS